MLIPIGLSFRYVLALLCLYQLLAFLILNIQIWQVSGQLKVGNEDSGSAWRSGTVQTIRHNPVSLVIMYYF